MKQYSCLTCCLVFVCLCFGLLSFPQSSAMAQNQKLHVPTTPHSLKQYIHKCVMYDNSSTYYVMSNGAILNQNALPVGARTDPPKGRDEFTFMLKLNHITYAVDNQGFVWQRSYPFREIVGRALPNRER